MQADFSVELGGDAPSLEIPWRSDDPRVCYFDLKIHPELVLQIPEAAAYPELASFLSRINAAGFPLATAKCDAWSSREVAPEEETFGDRKFVSYIDLVFVNQEDRRSFEKHKAFVRELCRLLSCAPEIAATVELVIRHCYYHQQQFGSESGEPNGPQSSATMGASEISLSGNEDVRDDYQRGDIAIDNDHARVEDDERPVAKDHDEHRNLATQHKPAGAMDHIEPYCSTDDVQADMTDLARVTKHELAASSDRQQPSSPEQGRANLPNGTDLFRMPQSAETPNASPERKAQKKGPIDYLTGFCITAYVTGFGDDDHDPVRRWAIALYLLQNAIVQLNPNSQPKH
jgi:hypothetical protein